MYRKYKCLKSQLLGETLKEQSSRLCKEKENVQKDEVFGSFLNKKHHEERNRCHNGTESTSYKARKWVPGYGFKTVVVTKDKPGDEGKEVNDVANREGLSTDGVTRTKENDTENFSQKVILMSSEDTIISYMYARV